MREEGRCRVLLAGVILAGFLGACASSGGATREVVADVRAPVSPLLISLPDGASFAWVDASSLLSGLRPADIGASDRPTVHGLREDVSLLLRSHAWRAVPSEQAEYLLTLAHVDRRGTRVVTAANVGDVREAEVRGAWLLYVLRRRADGAQRVITVPLYSDLETADVKLAPPTLALLLTR